MTEPTPDPTARLFELWASLYRNTHGKGRRPVLDTKRAKLITRAVDTHGADTVEAAIRGVGLSPWHMGKNPQGKKYTDLELVLRDAAHVERFAGYWDDADPDTATINGLGEGGDW